MTGGPGDGVATTHLDSGLTVVTDRMPHVRSVALGFWVGTGSVDEDRALAGASHFLEHLLFKGTAERSARQIAEAVDAVGGDMNAFTTKEYTAFYVRVLADSVRLATDILSDIVWDPAFRPDEVDAERQVILEEILMHGDEPADAVHDVLAGAMFPGHRLGCEVLGDAASIEAMGRDDIAAFHAAHYQPGNIVVAAAGDVDHDALVASLEDRLGGRHGGARPGRDAPAAGPRPVSVVGRDTEQAHLAVGMRGPDREDEDRYALSVIDHVLGGGMSSRLFQSIREERGLAYSVYSYRVAYERSGALAVYAGTAPARAGEVLELIGTELDRMATDGPTPAELDASRSHLRGATALGLEDSAARMSRIGSGQLVHGRVMSIAEVEAKLDALSTGDVREVAARVLGAPRTLAVIGPFAEGDFAPPASSGAGPAGDRL
jgi:predicted Zn-dependent peptidase